MATIKARLTKLETLITRFPAGAEIPVFVIGFDDYSPDQEIIGAGSMSFCNGGPGEAANAKDWQIQRAPDEDEIKFIERAKSEAVRRSKRGFPGVLVLNRSDRKAPQHINETLPLEK